MYRRFLEGEQLDLFFKAPQLDVIRLDLPVDPATLRTAQQKGERIVKVNGRSVVMHYTKTSVKESRERLLRAIRGACPVPVTPPRKDCAWMFKVVYVYAPKSLPQKLCGVLKITRPDGDNLTKDVLDCISKAGVAWADDSQAHCAGEFRRYAWRGEPAHILVTLRQMPPNAAYELMD